MVRIWPDGFLKGDLENPRSFVHSKMIKTATRLLLKVVDLLDLTVATVSSCQLTEGQVNNRLLRFRQGLNLREITTHIAPRIEERRGMLYVVFVFHILRCGWFMYAHCVHVGTLYCCRLYEYGVDHRVHREWQWPLSGVHCIMMEKSAQPREGGRPTSTPIHYINHHHIQSYSVRSS
jgi:hypothetical protein